MRWPFRKREAPPEPVSAEAKRIAAEAAGLASPTLPCDRCAYSAALEHFPGRPTGERSCTFCVRNPQRPTDNGNYPWEGGPVWHDGKTPPFKVPMDCYIATDRLEQQRIFDELERLRRTKTAPVPRQAVGTERQADGEPVYCCGGGPAPGGHEWTCYFFLGGSP